jgi:hypothetical protein
MPPPPKNSPYRLLVEGPDDQHAVTHLMKRHGFDWDNAALTRPFIEASGGVSELLDSTKRSTDAKSYSRLGLVIDADLVVPQRWAQVQGCFGSVGIQLPAVPAAEGTVIEVQQPGLKLTRLGFWLMPDNQQPGILEHFLGKLVPAADPCWAYAEEVTTRARALGSALQDKDHAKGRIHTWLAWQRDPGLPFGTALTAQVLGHDSPEALNFVSWFQHLFVAP